MTENSLVGPTPAVAAPALPRQRVSWHSFDLRTGRRGQQLAVSTKGTPSRILCEPTELQMAVRCYDQGAVVPGWDSATQPGRVMIVALDEDTEDPLWGGMVYRRRSDSSAWVALDTVTLEGYFDRRFVYDHDYTATDQGVIAAGIIADADYDGIEFVVDHTWRIPRLRDRSYAEDEDKTILSALTELAGVEAGIEFTVNLSWADATHTRLQRTVRIAERIGIATDQPAVTFTMPGSVIDFGYVEDYSAEHGANAVQAVSSGEGDTRPESQWWNVPLNGNGVRFEKKFTPSTSITDTNTLDFHARDELLATWDGLNELTLDARLEVAPRIGVDWNLGDDVGVSLTCPRFPARRDADGAVVPGYQAVVRAVGYDLDLDANVIRPRLLEAMEVEVEAL